MNKTWLCLVGLILVSSTFQIAVSGSNPSSYDVMADINRDRTIDVNDLSRLGRAYGSNLVLASELGKTVVTVLSSEKEPPEVENARVAVFDPELFDEWFGGDARDAKYTNSSGTAIFELDPDRNFTAIAWSGLSYNYANFTTNSLGEASVLVMLGESALPKEWVVVTLLDNETGSLFFTGEFEFEVSVQRVTDFQRIGDVFGFISEHVAPCFTFGGAFVLPLDPRLNKPHSRMGLVFWDIYGNKRCLGFYSPNDDGCANVVVYVTPP